MLHTTHEYAFVDDATFQAGIKCRNVFAKKLFQIGTDNALATSICL